MSKNIQKENGTIQKLDEVHLLRSLLDLIPDPILIKDREGKYVRVNRAKLEELGAKDFKDVIGKTARDFFSPEVADSFKPDDDQVLQTGKPVVNRREKVTEPNGTIRWHLTTKVPWRDNEGNIVGLMSISRDITESVVAEQKLQDERNLLRTLIDNMPDCIYAKDTEGRKIIANPGDLKNLGCKTEADAVGKTDFDLFPKQIAEQFFIAEKQVLEHGHSLINHEEKVVRPDGEVRWVLSSKIPWRDANGKIIGLVGIGRDITDRKNLEAQIQQAQRMESIGRLATGVAHDLNNILAPILISIELLRKKLQDEEYLKMLAKAEANAHRGADIIKQMLWFSRGLSGQRVPVKLGEVAGGIAQFASETFPKSIKVEKQIATDLWTVVGDSAQLNQVLMNLVTNARDAMPDGGALTIATKNVAADGRRFVVLEVIDTGVGIQPELLDRVFEPFFTTKEVGHGLGLSTALSIVKSHDGFIKVESEPGNGAIFRVHLPAQV
jgi:PAS domain S-box-containing protein